MTLSWRSWYVASVAAGRPLRRRQRSAGIIERGLPYARCSNGVKADVAAVETDEHRAHLGWPGRVDRTVINVHCAKREQPLVKLSVAAPADEAITADSVEVIVEVSPVEDHSATLVDVHVTVKASA